MWLAVWLGAGFLVGWGGVVWKGAHPGALLVIPGLILGLLGYATHVTILVRRRYFGDDRASDAERRAMKEVAFTSLGFAAAPLAGCLVVSLTSPSQHGLEATLFIYVFALPMGLLLGFPAFVALRYFERVTWWSSMAVGIVTAVAAVRMISSSAFSDLMLPIGRMGIAGALSGLVFWALWRAGFDKGRGEQ